MHKNIAWRAAPHNLLKNLQYCQTPASFALLD